MRVNPSCARGRQREPDERGDRSVMFPRRGVNGYAASLSWRQGCVKRGGGVAYIHFGRGACVKSSMQHRGLIYVCLLDQCVDRSIGEPYHNHTSCHSVRWHLRPSVITRRKLSIRTSYIAIAISCKGKCYSKQYQTELDERKD